MSREAPPNREASIALSQGDLPSVNLQELLHRRHSPRRLSRKEVRSDELGGLLAWAVGKAGREYPSRAYPSAGALYPNRIFVVVERVTGLLPGMYEYEALNHSLEFLTSDTSSVSTSLMQKDIEYNFSVVISAEFEMAAAKYGARGYRFCLLEAGHIMQNLLLVATAMGLESLPVGGFLDHRIRASVETQQSWPVYLAAFGGEGAD